MSMKKKKVQKKNSAPAALTPKIEDIVMMPKKRAIIVDQYSSVYELKNARNGWMIVNHMEEGEEYIVANEDSNRFSYNDDEEDVKGYINLLYSFISDHGPSGGKYNKRNIHICCLPGYSYEGKLDDEYRKELLELRSRIDSALETESEETEEDPKA